MAAQTHAATDVLTDLEGYIRRQVIDEMRDVECCPRVQVEHIRPMCRIALAPRNIREVVYHPRTMVSLVYANANETLLVWLPPGVPYS